MRLGLLLLIVCACDSAPTCKEAVTHAAKRFANEKAPEATTLIGLCEQTAWKPSVRTCFDAAKTADALVDCLPSGEPKVVPPTLEASQSVKSILTVVKGEPIRALLFFPESNAVDATIEPYFKTAPIPIEHHDRFVDVELAKRYKISRDGVVVLVRGDKSQTIELDTDLGIAVRRGLLTRLDREVSTALLKLTRPSRVAYVLTGHGEINDRASLPADLQGVIAERKTTMLAKQLQDMNFEMKPLPPLTLVTDVPTDATVVLALAPSMPLDAKEWLALDRYLDRGGALLFALDPTGDGSLGPLSGKFRVTFDPAHVIDDESFLPQRKSLSDHRFVVTNRVSAHPTTAALTRAVSKGIVMIDAGSLTALPPAANAPKVTFTIRSMDSAFRDVDDNLQLSANEHKGALNFAAAIEGVKWRALVYADVDLFADVLMQTGGRPSVTMISGTLFVDSMHWLAGEEAFVADPADDPSPREPPSERDPAEREALRHQRGLARDLAHP